MPLRVEDAQGNLVWRPEGVDAYGELDEANGSPCPTRLRFAGHFYDEHLGLFYNRFRDYDPKLGRYLQSDPLGHAGGINLFAYSPSPLANVDLRGLIHRAANKAGPGKGSTKGKPAKEPDGPHLPGVSKKERKLAASPGNSKAKRAAREKVVRAFAKKHAQHRDRKNKPRKTTKADIQGHVNGTDLRKPVIVGPPPEMKPSRQYQTQGKGRPQGQYYGDEDAKPTELGIAGIDRGPDGRYRSKEKQGYDIDPDAPYMESTAAPINDDWSVKGQEVPTRGGARQRVVPDRSKAKQI